MKTETGEIISKKEALVREAMECGFQRFEAEAFYNCLRRFEERVREAINKEAKAHLEELRKNFNAESAELRLHMWSQEKKA